MKELLHLLEKLGEANVKQLAEELHVSRQYLHRQLLKLQAEDLVEKLGKAPRTYYRIKTKVPALAFTPLPPGKEAFLNQYFLVITETGDRLEGPPALARWCSRQKLPYEKTADEYIRTMQKYLAYRDQNGLIEGIGKLKNTTGFSEIGLDQLYYSDFYAIERFGKTRLGTLLHIAKQTQNQQMIREISQFILTDVYKIIQQEHIDAVGYIPPTLKRDVQFMTVMQNTLNLSLPHLHLLKIRGDIVIPQKALSRLEERIENARSTIMVYEKRKFHRVLLIDDAVGSGATMNETALKLKARAVADYVIGYAVTGSFKGFDVIQEV